MNKKILVIGGTGFLGFNLLKRLKRLNFYFTLYLQKTKKKKEKFLLKYITCDISKKTQLKKKV